MKRSTAPYLILLLVLTLGLVSSVLTLARGQAEPATLTAEIDAYLGAQLATGRFMGSVLVARGDKVLFERGYGMANLELGVHNTADTVFRIGSLTKQFTAVATLQLQEQGLLQVDDTLSTYLPDYPQGDEITLQELLTHTSGVPELLVLPAITDNSRQPFTIDELIATFKDLPLDFEPGTRFNYSNSGYVLLTKVIETVTGQPYAVYLKERIFEPLSMTHTAYDNPKAVLKNRASGYVFLGSGYANADFVDLSIPSGAGALHSTLGDLYTWNQALTEETIITRASREAMIAKTVRMDPARPTDFYGYGQVLSIWNGHRLIEHSGAIDGFAATLSSYPDDGLVVVVLSNVQDAPTSDIAHDVAAIVFGESYQLPEVRTAAEVDAATLARYTGRYTSAPDFDVTVFTEDGRLFARPAGGDPVELFPESEGTFFLTVIDAHVTFIWDESGTVTGLTFKDNAAEGPTVSAQKVE